MVAENLARGGPAKAAQGAVWEGVDHYLKSADVQSRTDALDDVFSDRAGETEAFIDALGDIDACGAVVVLNGEIVGVDFTDSKQTFARLWRGLLRGYAMDAVLERGSEAKLIERKQVEEWLESVSAAAEVTRHTVAGVAEHHSIRAPGVAGAVTMHHDRAVHVALFAAV